MHLYRSGRALDLVSACSISSFSNIFGNKLIGANRLAYCEIYVMLGTMFRRFGWDSLEANDLKPEDMVIDDYFGPHYPADAPKLHVSSSVI